MSAQGLLGTVLATQLVEAIDKDDFIGAAGDIAAGRFGPHLTALVRDVARQLDERGELLAFARQLASCEIPEAVDYAEEARRLVDQAEGGAA